MQYLGRKPQGSAGTSSINVGSTAANRNVLLHRSISDGAIAAGTLSGTVNWTIGVKESATGLNGVWRIHIYVTTGSTDTPRGVLLSNYTGTTQFTTTATGASDGTQTVTPVNVQVGDRIVCEIGYQANASATTQNATINYGNVGTTDLAITDTAVTVEPGWFEFSGADGLFTHSFTTLTDTFATSIDAKWTTTAGVSDVSGRARINCTTTLADMYTATPYEIQSSTLALQVPTLPATGGGSGAVFSAYLSAGPTISTTNCEITYSPGAGNLMFRNNVGGADGSPTTLTYDPVAHQWWRFKENAGSILMETSPDNVTWTTRRTITVNAQWMRLGTLIFYVESSRTSGTADFGEIDNINPPAAHIIAVGTASEIDTAQSIGRTKTRAVSTAGQVDTAQSLGRLKTKTLTFAGQVDTAQPIGRVKTRALGTVSIIETALPLGRLKTAAVTTASQIDAAQALGRAKAKAITTASQTDTAQAPDRIKTRPLSTASTIATAIPISPAKLKPLGTATELNTAIGITIPAGPELGDIQAGPARTHWTAGPSRHRWTS